MLDRLALQGGTGVLSAAGLAAGTTTTVTLTNDVQYKINGKNYKKTATSNIAAPTVDALKGTAFSGVKAGYCSVFTYGLNANGDLKCVQGSIEPLDRNYSVMNAPQWGAMPEDFCPIGYLFIKAGSTADATTGWVQGTSNQASVTGITYTRADGDLPARPVTS